ncbi:MAG: hypothetical protein EBT84_09590 [Sphingomonadaceae bacterium]|jgi:hypothetical protein|nr:hypothetical protein [Sphingomonadaceae bacterium]
MKQQIIMGVVRGEKPWSDLSPLGVTRDQLGWRLPRFDVPVYVTLKDLEAGLENNSTCPIKRREWAQFMLAASGLVEIDATEDAARREVLLGKLWDIAFSDG